MTAGIKMTIRIAAVEGGSILVPTKFCAARVPTNTPYITIAMKAHTVYTFRAARENTHDRDTGRISIAGELSTPQPGLPQVLAVIYTYRLPLGS